MSGSPKYTQAELEERRRQELQEKRRREAEEERRRREEAAARERARRMQEARSRLQEHAGQIHADLQCRQGELYPEDFKRLQAEIDRLRQQVDSAGDEEALADHRRALQGLSAEAVQAAARRRREEEERQRREEIDRLAWETGECERRLAEVSAELARRFDVSGRQHSQAALMEARSALSRQDLPMARSGVAQARQAVDTHVAQVTAAAERWAAQRDAATLALDQAQAMLAGLSADAVTSRWQADRIAQMQQEAAALAGLLEAESFGEVQNQAQVLLQAEPDLVAEANRAQLQADHRDAIADSVRQALEQMGFFVSAPRPEHPDHPATAMLLEARSAAGKAIGVSVPVEGEIWYDVEGYAMNTAPMPGGGAARSCDEAERVLLDLHRVLGETYGVQTGEVMWEGKDPNRNLNKRDALPTSGGGEERGRQR